MKLSNPTHVMSSRHLHHAGLCNASSVRPILKDGFDRPVDYVRIAVTSSCNLRCTYCMREEHEVQEQERHDLSVREIDTVVRVLAAHGVSKIRFTGGEPLLRKDIAELVRVTKNQAGIRTVSLTTNGLLLDRCLPELLDAGIDSINFSIDTFRRERYHAITRRNEYDRARSNLQQLLETGDISVKLNVVLMKNINSDEIMNFVELARKHPLHVRFIELQPFDEKQIWRTGRFFGAEKILEQLVRAYPEIRSVDGSGTESYRYSLPDFRGVISIIPAFTRNFCGTCNKLRITSKGMIVSCLYKQEGLELLPLLRSNSSDEAIAGLFHEAVSLKPENGRFQGTDSAGTSMSEIGG